MIYKQVKSGCIGAELNTARNVIIIGTQWDRETETRCVLTPEEALEFIGNLTHCLAEITRHEINTPMRRQIMRLVRASTTKD